MNRTLGHFCNKGHFLSHPTDIFTITAPVKWKHQQGTIFPWCVCAYLYNITPLLDLLRPLRLPSSPHFWNLWQKASSNMIRLSQYIEYWEYCYYYSYYVTFLPGWTWDVTQLSLLGGWRCSGGGCYPDTKSQFSLLSEKEGCYELFLVPSS